MFLGDALANAVRVHVERTNQDVRRQDRLNRNLLLEVVLDLGLHLGRRQLPLLQLPAMHTSSQVAAVLTARCRIASTPCLKENVRPLFFERLSRKIN